MFDIELVEGNDRRGDIPTDKYDNIGKRVGWIVKLCSHIYSTGKVVIIYRDFCVFQGIIALNQLYIKHNPTNTASDDMVLISKGVRIVQTEYPQRERPFVGPNKYFLVKTTNLQSKKTFLCVILPSPNNIYHLPELIQKEGRQLISIS